MAVRCAVCRYVFRVDAPSGAAQAWRVQTVDGDLFEAEDLPTLRVWIREGRLHPDDTISRTGKHWIRLGDMPEFSDAFAGFPDLPAVLGGPEGAPLDSADLSAVGPPPSFAGDDVPLGAGDVPTPMARQDSERLDMSGLFSTSEFADDGSSEDPDDTVVRGRAAGPSEDTVTVGQPGVVSRTSLFEDSASMVLDDLVAPPPEPEPAHDRGPDLDMDTVVQPEPREQAPGGPRRKPKHQTRKVRTVASVAEADPEASGVVRVLDEAEVDAAQPRSHGESSDTRKGVSGASMLGAVTAHVKSGPVKPLTGPVEIAEREPTVDEASEASSVSAEPEGLDSELELGPDPQRRRSTWPLFAGLGLLCGAAVVFGIPQVRERVLGSSGASTPAPAAAQSPALATVDAAIREGTVAKLEAAVEAATQASSDEGLEPAARADLALARAEAHAMRAIALRLQAVHAGKGSDASFRAADAAEAAGQAFAGVDVERASASRLARTRARVRLSQGRPQDEVLPLVPDDAPELRALALGAPLWGGADARVPSGLISALGGLSKPSVPAQVLLATAYARGGDDVGASAVREQLQARAGDDPAVKALLATPAVVADAPVQGEDTPKDPPADTAEGGTEPETPEDTIIVKDAPKAMSVDKLIERGCSKVEGGDVSGGLKLLLRAFDRRPDDLDVLVCLGAANRKKGVPGTALRYYERALKRSPKFMPALLGAARSAAKMGQDDKAVGYYRRVLGVAPGNAEAKSFVAKNNAPAKKPTPPSDSTGGDADRKPEPPKPDKPAPPSGDRKPEPPKPEPSPE